MTKARLSFVLLVALGAGFVGGFWYNERERVSADAVGSRRLLYYVDPMHPAYTSDKPGTAPDCGMTLAPVYSDSVSAGARVDGRAPESFAPGALSITPEQQHLIGMRVAPVEKRSSTERLRLYGRVAADETRLYRINVGVDGYVRDVSAATTGNHVRKDERLVTLSAPDARAPIQGYIVALEVLDRASKEGGSPGAFALNNSSVQQSVERLLTLGLSRAQLAEIDRTRQVPPALEITAPAEGFVIGRNASIGQKVQRGDELFRIADLRRVWILADVFGHDAEFVRAGMTAGISIPNRPRRFHGIVSRHVVPQFDTANQSVRLRIEVQNPDLLLQPGMSVDVEVPVDLPPALVVPVDAVIHSGRNTMVFVERRPGVFERRDVETGWHFAPYVEIVKGLSEGERIVVSGTFLVDSESRLRHSRTAADPR